MEIIDTVKYKIIDNGKLRIELFKTILPNTIKLNKNIKAKIMEIIEDVEIGETVSGKELKEIVKKITDEDIEETKEIEKIKDILMKLKTGLFENEKYIQKTIMRYRYNLIKENVLKLNKIFYKGYELYNKEELEKYHKKRKMADFVYGEKNCSKNNIYFEIKKSKTVFCTNNIIEGKTVNVIARYNLEEINTVLQLIKEKKAVIKIKTNSLVIESKELFLDDAEEFGYNYFLDFLEAEIKRCMRELRDGKSIEILKIYEGGTVANLLIKFLIIELIKNSKIKIKNTDYKTLVEMEE